MVLSTQLRERHPPGGSSLAGQFEGTAFASAVFPPGDRSGKGAFKDRLQRREHLEMTLGSPGARHSTTLEYTSFREPVKPSRLRMAYNEHAATALREQHLLKPSASCPTIGTEKDGWETLAGSIRIGSTGNAGTTLMSSSVRSRPASRPESAGSTVTATDFGSERSGSAAAAHAAAKAAATMNSRWYPHPSTGRGTLKLSQPKALWMGVDPGKDTGHQCPFFEASKHRFAQSQKLPDARPRTPTKSLRWRSSDAWDNPDNHFTMKVTQTFKSSMGSTGKF